MTTRRLVTIIEREGDGDVALCPEVDVTSEGDTIEQARAILQEALELFFDSASPAEIAERLHGEVYITTLEVAVCKTARLVGPQGLSMSQEA